MGQAFAFFRIMRQRVVKTLFQNRPANCRGSPAKCAMPSCCSTPSTSCTCARASQNKSCPKLLRVVNCTICHSVCENNVLRFSSGQRRARKKTISIVPYLLVFQPKIIGRMYVSFGPVNLLIFVTKLCSTLLSVYTYCFCNIFY